MKPSIPLHRQILNLAAFSVSKQGAHPTLFSASSCLHNGSRASTSPLSVISSSTLDTISRRAFASKKSGPAKDRRITLLRYHLHHPLTPRPLRLSRIRHLRHWTIHRAYQLQRAKDRQARERELERMYNAQRAACEELRLLPGDEGRLFRRAMVKKGVFGEKGGWPIEATRAQTEWPSREGWNAGWTR